MLGFDAVPPELFVKLAEPVFVTVSPCNVAEFENSPGANTLASYVMVTICESLIIKVMVSPLDVYLTSALSGETLMEE